ncbi:MAG: hydroxyacylglutathione hydrolase [Thioalkalivibrionaceae bacterium]
MPLIHRITAFEDNYIWLIVDPAKRQAVVVDPGDAGPVQTILNAERLTLDTILVTHKHADHVGGIPALLESSPRARVYGPADETIPGRSHRVREGDLIELSSVDMILEVIDVRGHTEGHVAYYAAARAGSPPLVFCGDALFAGGCGRVFTGNYRAQAESLMKLAALPPETRVYCAHEYTADNLGFAAWVEPDNPALHKRIAAVNDARARGEATVPSTIADELATNPFLRLAEPAVLDSIDRWSGQRPVHATDAFAALRRWKDEDYDR